MCRQIENCSLVFQYWRNKRTLDRMGDFLLFHFISFVFLTDNHFCICKHTHTVSFQGYNRKHISLDGNYSQQLQTSNYIYVSLC